MKQPTCAASLLLFALLLSGLSACKEKRSLPLAVSSFKLELDGSYGTLEAPLPFPDAPVPVSVTITALSNRGKPIDDLDFEVEIFAPPGKVKTPDALTQVRASLVAGHGQGDLVLIGVYGRTHVCVKDNQRGEDSTYATGCTPTLYFEMPRVDQVQVTDDATTSPLVSNFLEIRSGDLIVTGIFAEGFYLTDLAAPAPATPGLPGDFGSLFIFSFSFPEGLLVGDRVSSVIGTVQEFTGATQLTFPSWTRKEVPTDRCAVPWLAGRGPVDCPAPSPLPVRLDETICAAPTLGTTAGLCGHATDNLLIESLESSVVRVEDVLTPTRLVDCDFNLDGDVANFDPSCDRSLDWAWCEQNMETANGHQRSCCEIACKADCNIDMTCTELSSLATYGQWSGAMNGGAGPKVNFLTRQGYPELDPRKPEFQGITLDIAGNLRHSLPARPRWVVIARGAPDVVFKP